MAKAYYSTVFEHPAPEVWKIVRDFNNYPVWVGGAASLPMTGYQATLRITPVVDGDRAFVEWWATCDCDAGQRDGIDRNPGGLVREMARIAARHTGGMTRVPRSGSESRIFGRLDVVSG
jgi:hypothetical protein